MRVHADAARSGWAALEMLARFHGLPSLADSARGQIGVDDVERLESLVDDARVNYRVQPAGTRYLTVLRYADEEQLGAIVAFRPLKPGGRAHLVVLVGFDDDEARVIDPADEVPRVRTMARGRFLSWWDGFTLVVEPEVTGSEK